MALEYDDISVFQNPTKIKSSSFEPQGIPTIDLSPLLTPHPNSESLKPLLEQIENACMEWGFFQVVNHGVPLELLEKVHNVAKVFFALPLEEKKKVAKTENHYLITKFTLCREVCMEYGKAVEALAFKLLEAITMTLNLPPNRLTNYFMENSTSTILFNHYPPCPLPERILGVNPHTDVAAITVLAQDDVDGLEVKRRSDGKWVRVKPVPNSYIINIGDLFQIWSNDKYESAEHRVVVNTTKDRFSIPFFLSPENNAKIKPLEELLSEDGPSKYQEFVYGVYFKASMDNNFKKREYENLETRHFRKN